MQDVIKREVTIQASKEAVYEAIANPEKVVQWFPNSLEGSYKAGEHTIFDFGLGKETVYVTEAKPYEYFAYRWVPGGAGFMGDVNTVPNTLVEFRIEEHNGACKVVMTESGFSSLPDETAQKAFEQNNGGWDYMLGRLDKCFPKN